MSHINNLEKFVPDLKNRKILDLGCGRGGLLIDFLKNGYQAVGFDKNPEYIDIVNRKVKDNGVTVELYCGEAEKLPFADKEFNFINCNEVIEHVKNPELVLRECHRVLNDGGKMYVSICNRYGIYDSHYRLWFINLLPRKIAEKIAVIFFKINQKTENSAGYHSLAQMHYFTYKQAITLFKKYCFESIETHRSYFFGEVFTDNKIIRLLRKIKLYRLAWLITKNFIGVFHFFITKNDNINL
jgi:2-polyprenyl-3-methyl-5-hydroxy-6-metoxy-1,4-benzoquinol methylase